MISAETAEQSDDRANQLADVARRAIYRRADRFFAGLLAFQWVVAVGLAVWVSPLTWDGPLSRAHPHVWAAVLLGLGIIALPVGLALARPGRTLTRHVVAAGQMFVGALIIHLTGGRIESHFHVFGSLAVLAFYRDWRVLVTASAIAAADHFVRGLVWPESVYGTPVAAEWRWVEHVGWVAFIDLFLVYTCWQGDRDLLATAERQAGLERAQATVEEQVRTRTAELRASEAMFRSVFGDASIGMAVLDIDGRFLQVNQRLCRMIGYDEAELLARHSRHITHPDDLPGDSSLISTALAGGSRSYEREKRYIHRDGHTVWVHVYVTYVVDETGRPQHVVSQIQDITQRRVAEAALRESEERFRGALEHAAIGMALVTPDGRWLRVNPSLCQIVGYTEAELLARTYRELTHPDDLAASNGHVARLLGGDVPAYQYEKRYVHKTGRPVWVQLSVSLVRDAGGVPLHLVAQIQDVSDRRRAEDELRRTRAQLMDAIECLDAGMVMFGPDERLVLCNSRYREIYAAAGPVIVPGARKEDVLAAFARAGGHAPSGLPAADWVANRLATHRNPGASSEERIGDRWVQLSDRRTSDGGVVSLRTDVTALKEAREEAVAANRARGEFLANMSHEIRTPLNGILGMTELVLRTDLTRDQRESLGLVLSSAEGLMTVINDILDFSKIEAGKLDLDAVPFCLRDSVGDTLKTVALRAHSKGLELTGDVRPDVPEVVVGDAGRLRQVLTNLVGNAVKFTETGEVVVSVERVAADGDKDLLRFAVRDTGIGIPKHKQASIFESFTQADGSTTRRYDGTGLGLTISTRLVNLMGGRIWVESEPGVGSTFYFEVAFARSAGALTRPPVRPVVDLRGVAVLVVDDNATNRRVLEDALRAWGAAPTCVDSGPAALTELRRAAAAGEPYPLILLDAMMPDMDGFTVAGQIAREPDLAGPAVMMLTSADGPGDMARCREFGLAAYLVKPIKSDELLRAIASVLPAGGGPQAPLVRTPTPRATSPGSPPVRPLRILLAEDNPVNRQVAVRLLEQDGHDVTVAHHGGEAVAAVDRRRFDLVLMDVQMPEVDGFEATRTIRGREAATGRRTPIVAMTAHAMKGDRERCLDAGMDEYLSKPIRWEDLRRILEWAAANTSPAAEPPLDRASAVARLGGDEALWVEVAGMFRAEAPRMRDDVRRAFAAGDAAGLRRSAHALKGAAGYVGGGPVAEAADRIERIAAAGDLTPAAPILDVLDQEIERLVTALIGGDLPVSLHPAGTTEP
ncbi:PAS domain S-box protein [Fimbriiglobus ruber]|uniref:Sensory/regulatory protein RpfC n=1 Tax=Fimbriiglobus ruber TaxID=1908690 RepID=A0A225DHE2_9BACT|nr:PAS domain S-box protein [Fimbriiglobus ruber]OWK36826.1 PAS/PAC sensor hybrid histidine kinase [Fimbriiglobus ruber]